MLGSPIGLQAACNFADTYLLWSLMLWDFSTAATSLHVLSLASLSAFLADDIGSNKHLTFLCSM